MPAQRMKSLLKPSSAVVLLGTLTVLSIALGLGLLLHSLRLRQLEQGLDDIRATTELLQQQSENHFETLDRALQTVADKLRSPFGLREGLDSAAVYLMLNQQASQILDVSSFFVADAEGRVRNTSRAYPTQPRQVVADRVYFQSALKAPPGELVFGDVVDNRVDGRRTLHLARAVRDDEQRPVAVVVASVDLVRFIAQYQVISRGGRLPFEAFLADGTWLGGSAASAGEVPSTTARPMGWRPGDVGASVQMLVLDDPERGRLQVSAARAPRYPVWVSQVHREEDLLSEWRSLLAVMVPGGAVVAVVIMASAVLLATEFQHEERLSRALSAAEGRYLHTVESVMDAIVAVDESQIVRLFNPAAERMFGYPATQVIGRPLTLLMPERFRNGHVGG